jgi:DNA-binding protein HU-beta
MNKSDFVKIVSRQTKYTQKEISELLNIIFDSIVEGIKDEKITFVGFGTFEKRQRKARKGRHPQTGEELEIPARNAPYFSPGASFVERIND